MHISIICLIVLIILILAWVWSVGGRRHAPNISQMDGWLYAHRGFHSKPAAPENSAEAFRRAVSRGFGIELDVHLISDGTLVVFHDSVLKRMTGQDGILEDLTAADLSRYTLGKSREHIPLFTDVLQIVDGRTPLIIELKTWKGNSSALCTAVAQVLDHYDGLYCIESFDPKVVRWYRRNRPDVIRGQLSCRFKKGSVDVNTLMRFVGTQMLENVLTRPDFVAYRFTDRSNLSNQICRKIWHLKGAAWTIKTPEQLQQALQEGYWPIFERFDPGESQPSDSSAVH